MLKSVAQQGNAVTTMRPQLTMPVLVPHGRSFPQRKIAFDTVLQTVYAKPPDVVSELNIHCHR